MTTKCNKLSRSCLKAQVKL